MRKRTPEIILQRLAKIPRRAMGIITESTTPPGTKNKISVPIGTSDREDAMYSLSRLRAEHRWQN